MARQIETFVGFRYFFGENWCARCTRCGTVLTKFAFTEVGALREAESESCRCCRKSAQEANTDG